MLHDASIMVQVLGGKGVLTANLLGHAALMLALPAAARRGHRWVWCHPPRTDSIATRLAFE